MKNTQVIAILISSAAVQATHVNDLFARQDAASTTTTGAPATTTATITTSPSVFPTGSCGECTNRIATALDKCENIMLFGSLNTSSTALFVESSNCLCSQALLAFECAATLTGPCTFAGGNSIQVEKTEMEAFCKPAAGKPSCVERNNAFYVTRDECNKKPDGLEREKCRCNAVSSSIPELKNACVGTSPSFASFSHLEVDLKACEAKGIISKSGSVRTFAAFSAITILSSATAAWFI
ncbi:hypothetical protein HDV05_004028 [Chytridiales sp. JEL 0842]|nr:hypothetical protein HDV05_004028 [Chytridiales sp. JEL 0842]